MNKNKKNPGATRRGTYMVGTTAVVIAIVVVLNMIVGRLPASMLQFDISGSNLYQVSDTSKDVLSALDKDVQIIVLASDDALDDRISTYVEKYAALSDHVTLQVIDPVLYPSALETYNAKTSTVVVRCEDTDKQTTIPIFGFDGYGACMISYDYATYYNNQSYTEVNFDAEGLLTSAVSNVTSDVNETVYTLAGHSETAFSSALLSMISKANLTDGGDVNLLMDGGIPADCNLLLCNAPTTDLADDELAMLTDYLANGGDLMVILGSSTLTNFNTLLQNYGLAMQTGYVGDEDRFYSNYASYYGTLCFAPTLSTESDITADISADAIVLYARGMLQTTPLLSDVTVTPFLTTSSKGQLFTDEKNYTSGSYVLGAVSQQTGNDARLTVLSANTLIDESITSSFTSMSNLDIFMNAVTANFENVSNVSIPATSLSTTYITVNNSSLWSILFMVVIPLFILVGGFVYWMKRRKR